MREQLFIQSELFVEVLTTLHKNVSKGPESKRIKLVRIVICTPRKCFRCGSEDNLIAKCTKPPKEIEKRRKQVRLNENFNRAFNAEK